MTTTDTLLADLADVLDRASKLAKDLSATLAGPSVDMLKPAYHPERDGTLGELEPGDRVMWDGQWREVRLAHHHCTTGRVHLWLTGVGGDRCSQADETARIQKRHGNVTIPDDPLREYRLPSGRVAYAEEAARWVHVGDWIQAVHGDEGCWEQVVGTFRADQQTCITSNDGTRTQGRWWGPDDKVRVATAPVPDPEPYR